uniref:Replication-associated protein n=1 Tax=Anser anser CRESS-DNA-virus sp. TaxID=2815022 RepID=A0A8A4XCC1_9VIRU|nr:MAG: replication-associated protein [Anser anser CRESS-DNA-virus sp.]
MAQAQAQRIRSRAWCFTINNDTFDDLDMLLEAEFVYCIFGFEMGENETPHIQGYIYFENPREMKGIKKKVFPRAHLEIARGSPEQNYEYCSKDGEYYEFGEKPSGQGHRTDLKDIKQLIDDGGTLEMIADNHFGDFVRYHKAFDKYRSMQTKPKEAVFENINFTDLNFHIEGAMYVSKEKQLYDWDGEDTIVVLDKKGFDTFQLMMWEKGHPYRLSGKKVLPGRVICVADRI